MEKKYFVEDLFNSVGLTDQSTFVISSIERKTTRTNQPYIDLSLKDKTGEVSGKIWSDNIDETIDQCKVGDVILIDFEVKEYKGSVELHIRKVDKVNEYNPADFVLVPNDLKIDELKTELKKRIDSVRDFDLRKLLDNFFEDSTFCEVYCNSPAGMYIHHEYQHGLLQHCLEMLTILDSIIKIYPDLNHDLLTTGTLLHDIGKIKELKLSMSGSTEYTKEGQLLGHIAIGILLLEKRIPENFPESLREQLLHIIISHQGKRETGSPVVPTSREAFAVYYADLTSTYLNIAEHTRRKGLKQKSEGTSFSEYNRYLGSNVYLGE